MPFVLQDAGETFHRCMQHCFHKQISWNFEVYIDDIIMKTRRAAQLIADPKETFSNF